MMAAATPLPVFPFSQSSLGAESWCSRGPCSAQQLFAQSQEYSSQFLQPDYSSLDTWPSAPAGHVQVCGFVLERLNKLTL